LAVQNGATLFMVMIGLYKVLLHKISGQSDISVGMPVANRSRKEIEVLVGFFLNTLVLRSNVEKEMSFESFLGNIKNATLDAYAHQDVPFEQVVNSVDPERDPGRNPLFQTLFMLLNTPEIPNLELGKLTLTAAPPIFITSMFDVSFIALERPWGIF